MLSPITTIDAGLTAAQARTVLEHDHQSIVIVRKRFHGAFLWYMRTLPAVRRALQDADDDANLGNLLGLHEGGAQDNEQITSDDVRRHRYEGIVLDGTVPVGYAWPEAERAPTRGGMFDGAAGRRQGVNPGKDAGHDWLSRPAPIPSKPAPSNTPEQPPASEQSAASEVTAYPRIDLPERALPGSRFDVVVGLSARALPGVAGSRMSVLTALGDLEFTVQVVAPAFEFPDGIRRTLKVHRDRLDDGSVAIPIQVPEGSEPWWGDIAVEFGFEGRPVGRAWRQIYIAPAGVDSAQPTEPSVGSTSIAMGTGVAADLSVTISHTATEGTFSWTFLSPHPITITDQPVTSSLPVAGAKAFALGTVKGTASHDGTKWSQNQLRGIAREVGRAAPVEFWHALGQAWRHAADEGRSPSLFIVSEDPYVPWELASVEEDYIDDQTLVDPKIPPVLGAHLRIGRWLPKGKQTASGTTRPAVSPPVAVQMQKMAVVVGEYLAETGLRPLPFAKEEGTALSDTYGAVWVKGTQNGLAELLNGELSERGQPLPVQVVHMACHGEVEGEGSAYNGIVLSDSPIRINENIVRGSEIRKAGAPLVFLNACQLAQHTGEELGEYGGLAGAFLVEGCPAFIAPLWSVNDEIARDVALEFYRLTVGDKLTAGEAWRRIRASAWSERSDQNSALAYMYFGHPELSISGK